MGFEKTIMWINIEIDTYLFLECGFKFLLEIIDKLSNPAVVFVVFLTVADEDIIIISGDEACHCICSYA